MVEVVGRSIALPQLTTAQRNALPSPAGGTMIYNVDTASIDVFAGVVWVSLGEQGGSPYGYAYAFR